jgi:radical SAM protein with 4Fe4S-binding SPASM domain
MNECADLGRLRDTIREAKSKFGLQVVSLSGGETFLYPEFMSLYQFLIDMGLQVLIYTSGIILTESGERVPLPTSLLRRLRLSENNPKLFLNVEGHNKDLVEKINGVADTFALIEEAIENIKCEDLYVAAHVVPLDTNYEYLMDIFSYCCERSFNEIAFLRYVPQGRGAGSNLNNTKSGLLRINRDLRTILQSSRDRIDVRIGHPINFLFLLGCGEVYDKEKTHFCRGGFDAPLVLPDGDVSMCPAWKNLKEFSAGNIYRQSFEDIWMSKYFRVFREFVVEQYRHISEPCHSCQYLDACRGKCVAQRLLAQKSEGKHVSLEDSLRQGPDPQCFKELV